MAKLTKITVQYDAKVLEGITTPAGDPVYPPIQSDQEVQQALDFFTEDDSFTGLTTSLIDIQGVTPANTLSLLNDILIVRYIGNVSELPDLYEGRETGMAEARSQLDDDIETGAKRDIKQIIVSYEKYENKEYDDVLSLLYYNYGMPEESISNAFASIFKSIRDEFTPPFTTKSFVYDFKFCENQNGSIVTGSVARRAPTRTIPTRRTSGGGGY